MKLSESCIRRPVATAMLAAGLFVLGLASYPALDVSLYPNVDIPVVTVTVEDDGADPETIETEITDVIEEALGSIAGVKSMRSESSAGRTRIFIRFRLERDLETAAQDVRDRLAAIRAELPARIKPPVVEKFDADAEPILSVVLTAPAGVGELTQYADRVVKPQLAGVDGVGSVRLVGGREREVRIWLRADDLRRYNLAAADVIQALRQQNLDLPGGSINTVAERLLVKTNGRISSIREFEDVVVDERGDQLLRLRHVAWVEDGLEDAASLTRLNGQPALGLLVRRQSGSNALTVANTVKNKLDGLRCQLPRGFRLVVVQDTSQFVEENRQATLGDLSRGAVLATLVVLLCLRSTGGAFITFVTIPVTIVSTLAFVGAMDFSLNMLTMLALSLSVGLIIDDSIVVVEAASRHLAGGRTRREAVTAAMAEIGPAVIATSLAILAVFVPVAFLEGLVGRYFYEFAVTVSFAVVVSTFVALTLSPMLCARLLGTSDGVTRKVGWAAPTNSWYSATKSRRWWAQPTLQNLYSRMLECVLVHRGFVLAACGGLLIGGYSLLPSVGAEFVPDQDESQFTISIRAPQGSSLQRTSELVREVEHRLHRVDGVRELFTVIAGDESDPRTAQVFVQLAPPNERTAGQDEIMQASRSLLSDVDALSITVERVARFSGGGVRSAPLQYNLRGGDLAELQSFAGRMIAQLNNVPGIVDVDTSFESGNPELAVRLDRVRAADLGVDAQVIGATVRTLVGGEPVTTFQSGGETHDVRVRLAAGDRQSAAAIGNLPVRSRERLIELADVAEVHSAMGPVSIDRLNRKRQVTITANLEPFKPLGEAVADVRRLESKLALPARISTSFTGPGELMEESAAGMITVFILAAVLTYMVLAAQLESLLQPLAIVCTLPLALFGAVAALAITGQTLNVYSMIGIVLLLGLVSKNAVLLLDGINHLRRNGWETQAAIVEAGRTRLWPILMTAGSTVAGMLPLALGLGAGGETRAAMGVCVVGGLAAATVLTLVVVPMVYLLVEQTACRIRASCAARRHTVRAAPSTSSAI